MAANGRLHPACPNSSNPYHVCAEYCRHKIAESGKTPKDKNGLGNPYHECAEYCFKNADARRQGTKKESGSFGRRTNKGCESHPKSPQSNGSAKLHSLAKKKMEERNGLRSSSSQSPPEDISCRDYSFDKILPQSSLVMPISGFVKPDHPEEQTRTSRNSPKNGIQAKDEEYSKLHAAPTLQSFLISEDASGNQRSVSEFKCFTSSRAVQATNGIDKEDTELVISDSNSRVWVGKYHVKSSISSTLETILDKHGDITAGCQLESFALRAYYLECLCFVIQELKCTPFKYLTKSKVKEMWAILKDIEAAQINIGWLRDVLNQITDELELIGQLRIAEVTKANYDQDIEKRKEEMKSQLEELAQKENQVMEAKAQITETKARLSALELKYPQTKEIMSTSISEVEKLIAKLY